MARKKLIQFAVLGVVAAGLIAGGAVWWTERSTFERTENAFVQADVVQISPQVSGMVAQVLVADNQTVSAGQVVAVIDPSSFQAKLAQARASAEAMAAAVRSVDDKTRLEAALIAQRAAGVESAQAAAATASRDLTRQQALAASGFGIAQQLDAQRSAAQQTAAAVSQAKAALAAEQETARSLGSSRAMSAAQAQAALASVEQARLDLDRTVLRSPINGVIGAKAVRPGQLVQPGLAMMSVVPVADTFIVANFKETQLARMRIGQRVEIRADALGDAKLTGRIESFSPAAGQEFALIPVENAVGNFTKITQRVPVRIAIDRNPETGGLRPGLSVVVKVDVRDQSGVSFAQSGLPTPRLATK